ncbi:DUF4251 domain-containing protein [Mucilaginibacter sp. Bleaf8]|uniref:DUF4251 domain-containing protein n=1 Tax=Mucilaginibacter sp. Bleaf8 TaxID=2834430 RepID=UPI001BCB0A11|nr:DUF4251 domain-containing protein [Mucilaginibacter sp. Bleaf8]MBS7563368.1 DUF4251 domain-containing protein [Mucilaginibacter sp. Bleaf8]
MKTFKYLILFIGLSIFTSAAWAQDSTKTARKAAKAADIKKLLEAKRFVFQAQYANPLGGGVTSLNGRLINITPNIGGSSGHVYLNYNYAVKVRPDSVIAYLPYFGRTTFDPPINSSEGGVKFTSTKFGYDVKQGKKGNTIITITPQDAGYFRKMVFTVSSEGSTSLQMTITNRNAISYDGYIAEKD